MSRIDPEIDILVHLRQSGPLSRQELHQKTGLRPNTVGRIAGQLIERGLVAEGAPRALGPGRPGVPLSIDESKRGVVGLAITPGSVEGCLLNLVGRRVGPVLSQQIHPGRTVIDAAEVVLRQLLGPEVVALGVSTTGLLDAETRRILFSSAVSGDSPVSAQPIFDMAENVPLCFDNDMRALATQWQLTHPANPCEDMLLVHIRDGAIGASLMIDGKPNRGCVVGGNELGHTCFPVGRDPVTLEAIFSTPFLHRIDPDTPGDLASRVAQFDSVDTAMVQSTEWLAMGLANAANFVRPHRLVLASDLTRHTRFYHALLDNMRRTLLSPVAQRMRIETWESSLPQAAEAAGWLALNEVFYP
ncbi:MAG: ROK family protein [Algisphaera sp.]